MKPRALPLLVLLTAGPVLAQTINIDFGDLGDPTPESGYRAAGLPGFWNSIEATNPAITYDLVDVHGQPTGATMSQFGGTEILDAIMGAPGDPTGNDALLMKDALITHTTIESCLFFNGLENGTYEVRTYAWMPHEPTIKSNVHVDNNPTFTLVGGGWPGQHREQITYARHEVTVTTGFLGPHSGIPVGGDMVIGAALNAIQIRKMGPEPPLLLSADQLVWLQALDAEDYDVVRGDLGLLRATGGDFALAIEACLADDRSATELTETAEPDPGGGYFYLVRGNTAAGALTWDAPGSSQVGSRDAEIGAAAAACP